MRMAAATFQKDEVTERRKDAGDKGDRRIYWISMVVSVKLQACLEPQGSRRKDYDAFRRVVEEGRDKGGVIKGRRDKGEA
jgi:hypothetical protein